MFRRLKLLTYLQAVNLSSEDTLELMRRLETDSCRAEDYEVLIKLVRAHTELSADVWDAFPVGEWFSSARKAKGKRQGAKRTRRRRGR